MRQGAAHVNRIFLHGRVGESPAPSHVNHGVEFYTFPLRAARLSGAEDRLKVVVPLALLGEDGRPLARWQGRFRGERQELTLSGNGSITAR